MVCAAIGLNGKTEMALLNFKMNNKNYLNIIDGQVNEFGKIAALHYVF